MATIKNDNGKEFNVTISPLPKNCGECPFYIETDDDTDFAGMHVRICQLGSINYWGNLIDRAIDCPL
jgi:hypothetical protein